MLPSLPVSSSHRRTIRHLRPVPVETLGLDDRITGGVNDRSGGPVGGKSAGIRHRRVVHDRFDVRTVSVSSVGDVSVLFTVPV